MNGYFLCKSAKSQKWQFQSLKLNSKSIFQCNVPPKTCIFVKIGLIFKFCLNYCLDQVVKWFSNCEDCVHCGGGLYLWGMKLSHKLRAGILFKLLLHRNQHCAMNDTISQDFFPRQGQVSGSGSVSQPTFFVIFYPKSTKIALSNGPFWPPIWALIGN